MYNTTQYGLWKLLGPQDPTRVYQLTVTTVSALLNATDYFGMQCTLQKLQSPIIQCLRMHEWCVSQLSPMDVTLLTPLSHSRLESTKGTSVDLSFLS